MYEAAQMCNARGPWTNNKLEFCVFDPGHESPHSWEKQPEANTKFLASYYHRGSWWIVEIYAVDWDDAETICRKLSLRLDGEHKMTIPVTNSMLATVSVSWLADAVCWWKKRKANT